MVEKAEDYFWSSAGAHCGLKEDTLLCEDFLVEGLILDWSAWLEQGLTDRELDNIRSATSKGIPYASDGFSRELEVLLGIPILPRKRGRPSNKR